MILPFHYTKMDLHNNQMWTCSLLDFSYFYFFSLLNYRQHYTLTDSVNKKRKRQYIKAITQNFSLFMKCVCVCVCVCLCVWRMWFQPLKLKYRLMWSAKCGSVYMHACVCVWENI